MFKRTKTNEIHDFIMAQIADVEACMCSFETFIRAASANTTHPETLKMLADDVCKKEYAADVSLRRMIDSLPGSTFLPSTREDLISIATSCDKVANSCESVAVMAVFQHFRFPEDHADDLVQIMALTQQQFDLLEESISRMFSNMNELLKDHSILDRVRELETQVDVIEDKLYKDIFLMDMDLAHQMQLYNYVKSLCDLADIIEDIADKIQIMLVTRKN